jgi:hypothetical protein
VIAAADECGAMPLTVRRRRQPKVPAGQPFGCGFTHEFDSQRNFP